MTNWETINSVVRGAEWLAVVGTTGYFGALYGLQFLSAISPFNKKIKSQKHLERIVRERAPKAGLNPNNIDVIYSNLGETNIDVDAGDGRGKLSLDRGINCTINSVDHELCHLANDDCNREDEKGFHYYFVREPRAVLYEIFGIKLGWNKNDR